jgi:hypothetical protein
MRHVILFLKHVNMFFFSISHGWDYLLTVPYTKEQNLHMDVIKCGSECVK